MLNFPLISLKLKNAGCEILRLNFKHITSRFETRPVANSVYFLLNTRGIEIYGVYYKENLRAGQNQLVPIVKSSQINDEFLKRSTSSSSSENLPMTLLAVEEANDMLFTFCFETNPTKYENAEFSIRTRVASVEIFYEKTSITELLRFFKTDLIDFEEVKKFAKSGQKLA